MTGAPAATLYHEVALEMLCNHTEEPVSLKPWRGHISSRLTTSGCFKERKKLLPCLGLCFFCLSYYWKLNTSFTNYADDLPSPLLDFSMPQFPLVLK